jgi:hypothetical protein
MKSRRWITVVGIAILVILTSACTVEIARNTDGSLAVESTMTSASLQSEIQAALKNDSIQDVTVELQDGSIQVSAKRQRVQGSGMDDLSFRLDLGVVGGQLTATLYDVQLNGAPFTDERVATWNGRIASQLTRAAQRRPNRTLDAVTITDDGLTMRWTVETPRSRNQ